MPAPCDVTMAVNILSITDWNNTPQSTFFQENQLIFLQLRKAQKQNIQFQTILVHEGFTLLGHYAVLIGS